jgi:hypothetical protein
MFIDILQEGIDKEALLSEHSVAALGIKSPEELEQLENQASSEIVTVQSEDQKIDLKLPQNFFKLPIHPFKALVVLKMKYDDAWVRWLPETLWNAIRTDIGPINEINQNKIQALAVALSTDAPWQDWTTFENCGQAFNSLIPHFGQMQPLSSAQTALTVTILKRLQPFNFSVEVLGYISAVCLYNGIVYAPKEWFDAAQPLIDKQNANVEFKNEVKEAWEKVKEQDLKPVELDDSKPLDVHIAKLWAIWEYIRIKEED